MRNDWNVTNFSRYNNLSRLKWWHDSTWTKAPLKWIWPPIMLICTATWEWSSQPRDWLNLFPHLNYEFQDLNHALTWGRCRGWAQGGRGGGGAEGSIASRGVVVPRQGQALLLALAKRFLKKTSFGIGASKKHSETSQLNARRRWENKAKWWQRLFWWQLCRLNINDDHHL